MIQGIATLILLFGVCWFIDKFTPYGDIDPNDEDDYRQRMKHRNKLR